MKVSELFGAELDYWVGVADGVLPEDAAALLIRGKPYFPSTDWSLGGPLIEREHIAIVRVNQVVPKWSAYVDGGFWGPDGQLESKHPDMDGPTPLIAAMRAFVASKFGEEVSE